MIIDRYHVCKMFFTLMAIVYVSDHARAAIVIDIDELLHSIVYFVFFLGGNFAPGANLTSFGIFYCRLV